MSKLTLTTKEGSSVSLKAGETATLSTSHPQEVWVKKFLRNTCIHTGVTGSDEGAKVSLDLFYNLSTATVIILFAASGILLAKTLYELRHPTIPGFPLSSGIHPAIVLVLIAVVIRQSLTIKKTGYGQS